MPVTYKGEGISASRRARELILGSNWGRIQLPIHWCTLHCRTLTVDRSPLSALVTKISFSVSIGWQPIVPPPHSADKDSMGFLRLSLGLSPFANFTPVQDLILHHNNFWINHAISKTLLDLGRTNKRKHLAIISAFYMYCFGEIVFHRFSRRPFISHLISDKAIPKRAPVTWGLIKVVLRISQFVYVYLVAKSVPGCGFARVCWQNDSPNGSNTNTTTNNSHSHPAGGLGVSYTPIKSILRVNII